MRRALKAETPRVHISLVPDRTNTGGSVPVIPTLWRREPELPEMKPLAQEHTGGSS